MCIYKNINTQILWLLTENKTPIPSPQVYHLHRSHTFTGHAKVQQLPGFLSCKRCHDQSPVHRIAC